MKRTPVVSVLLAAVLALAGAAAADDGHGRNNGKKPPPRQLTFGPYTLTRADNGSCSTASAPAPWANDTFQRIWRVQRNADGTFRVTRVDRGTFTTTGPTSPGKCDSRGRRHGTRVAPGIAGTFHGYLQGTVGAGSFNPAGCVGGIQCGTNDDFLRAVFGNPSRFTCSSGLAGCKFLFEYSSGDRQLRYHHWEDRGTDGIHEYFSGDIATS
jgi:hypothetical protein